MKSKKNVCIIILLMMFSVLMTGCSKGTDEYNSSYRKISLNVVRDEITFKNVRYYDSLQDKQYYSISGVMDIISNTYNNTTLVFQDRTGKTGSIDESYLETDTPLINRPSSFKVYTDYKKTKYDIYNRK